MINIWHRKLYTFCNNSYVLLHQHMEMAERAQKHFMHIARVGPLNERKLNVRIAQDFVRVYRACKYWLNQNFGG